MKSLFAVLFVGILLVTCSSVNENPEEMSLSILLLGDPQCKNLRTDGVNMDSVNSETCLEYAYDKDNRRLILKHLNAGFNCCPESLWCTVVYRNDSILIQEFESHMGCKCNCLYDLDIEISGVEPGKYVVLFAEPYLGIQQPLVGTLDFLTKTQGSFCVARTNYPWGN